jgi:hypothetical protein
MALEGVRIATGDNDILAEYRLKDGVAVPSKDSDPGFVDQAQSGLRVTDLHFLMVADIMQENGLELPLLPQVVKPQDGSMFLAGILAKYGYGAGMRAEPI